jgi:hypothetical protein
MYRNRTPLTALILITFSKSGGCLKGMALVDFSETTNQS